MKKRTIELEEVQFKSYRDINPQMGMGSRTVEFQTGCRYAVVLAAFYSGNQYTTHRTQAAAIKASRRLGKGNWSHRILGLNDDGSFVELEIRDGAWGKCLRERF